LNNPIKPEWVNVLRGSTNFVVAYHWRKVDDAKAAGMLELRPDQ
jgi:hypothetical protein